MKKRILSILTALVLCLTLLPTAALADTTPNWTGWTELTANYLSTNSNTIDGSTTAVKVYLKDSDLTITSTITIKGEVTLDLNGHVLKMTGDSSVIRVGTSSGSGSSRTTDPGSLTLTDNNQTAVHYFTVDTNGLWSLCTAENCEHTDNHKTVTGGVITGGTGSGNDGNTKGGGVYVDTGSTFTMTGGNIVGCTSNHKNGSGGGGVFVFGSGNSSTTTTKFTMTGGSIQGCTTNSNGGGVYLENYGVQFTMSGNTPLIAYCTANNGGGVFVGDGTSFALSDGTIQHCTANGFGGGAQANGSFAMSGGTIKDCAAGYGGGVYVSVNGSVLKGGTIEDNKATKGGGVFVNANKRILTVGGGTTALTITGNTKGADTPNNIYLDMDSYGNRAAIAIDSNGLTIRQKIGISTAAEGAITGENGADYSTYFTADDPQYKVVNGDSNVLMLKKCYTVAWDFNGGTGSTDGATTKDVAGTTITAPTNTPTRAADASNIYTFAGWYTKVTGGTELTSTSAIPEGGVTYYAHWNETPIYTVTFDPNGGTVDPTSATTDIDGKLTLTELPAPTRSGSYRFDGWFTEQTGGTAVTVDTVYEEHTTVYAHWTYTGGSSRPSYAITVPDTEHGTVKVSPRYAERGDTVTITVTPDAGYTLETLTVLDKNGKEIELTDKGDGKYTFKMPAGKVEVKATFAEDNSMLNFFVDVTADQYYYDAVLWAAENGITGGVDENHFGPDLSCTRAQLVTFLWRAAGCPVVNYAMDFSDVGDSYYTEAVRWAASLGIVGGYGNGLFGSNDTITREQMATILYRFAQTQGNGFSGAWAFRLNFEDVSELSDWAVEGVSWCVMNDIMQGYDNNLMPKAECTRAQIVTMLYRLLGA